MKGMIPMNMFKSNGGFTLVELIVVIAILAILAGVAVPAYSSYIDKANEVQEDIDQHANDMAEAANEILEQAGLTGDIDSGVSSGSNDDAGSNTDTPATN